jgi:uncharacterized protein YkwD
LTSFRRTAAGLCMSASLAIALLSWAVPPGGAQTAGACPVSADDQAVDAQEQALLGLVNQYRQSYGKAPLAMHPAVTTASAWFSRDMASKNYFPPTHVDSNGRAVDQRLTWCGVTYVNWAENIYAGSADAQSVFNAWRASSTHNANMLRDGVTSAGVARAYAAGSAYGWYWTLDLTDTAPAAATTATTTTASTTTSTTVPVTTTTTTAPTTTTTTTWPTTTTTRPTTSVPTTTPPPTTAPPATTTTVLAAGPAPGTAAWYWQQYYLAMGGR